MARTFSGPLVVVLLSIFLSPGGAAASPVMWASSGAADFTYGPSVEAAGGPATGFKPESKLFVTADNVWWGVFGDESGVALYRLRDHAWTSVYRLPGSDPWEKADTVLSGSTLWVSLRDSRLTADNPRRSRLYRLTYDGSGAWSLAAPVVSITTARPETVTVDVAANGRLWTAFIVNGAIRVGRLATSGSSFAFVTLPGVSPPAADDIAQVVAFSDAQGAKIGVLWSDQATGRDWLAWRFATSTQPLGVGWTIETAWGGGVGCSGSLCADDHLNAKTADGVLYAVVKTSMNDAASPDPGAPLIVLLRRSASGMWTSTTVSTVAENASRPVLVLAPSRDRMFVFAERNFRGTYVWDSSLSAPAFGTATAWTVSGSKPIGNPTATKQAVDATTGLVVETSLGSTDTYWHNELAP
jgi:hypothetical protein